MELCHLRPQFPSKFEVSGQFSTQNQLYILEGYFLRDQATEETQMVVMIEEKETFDAFQCLLTAENMTNELKRIYETVQNIFEFIQLAPDDALQYSTIKQQLVMKDLIAKKEKKFILPLQKCQLINENKWKRKHDKLQSQYLKLQDKYQEIEARNFEKDGLCEILKRKLKDCNDGLCIECPKLKKTIEQLKSENQKLQNGKRRHEQDSNHKEKAAKNKEEFNENTKLSLERDQEYQMIRKIQKKNSSFEIPHYSSESSEFLEENSKNTNHEDNEELFVDKMQSIYPHLLLGKRFMFIIDESDKNKDKFIFSENTIEKVGRYNAYQLHSKDCFQKAGRYYFSLQTEKINSGDITIGLINENQINESSSFNCVHCICYYGPSKMIYEYGLEKKKIKKEIKAKDLLILMVDLDKRNIEWVVNGESLHTAKLSEDFLKEKIYAYFEIISKGTIVRLNI